MTFKKYSKIKRLGHEDVADLLSDDNDVLVIQEKIDGANFRFMVSEDGRLIFGSRNNSLGDSNSQIGGNWKRCVEHVKGIYETLKPLFKKNMIYYGECMSKHSIDYDWDKHPPFIGFDVYDVEKEKYLDWEDAKKLFEVVGLQFVHVIGETDVASFKKKELLDKSIPRSRYYAGQAEGIVIKNYNKQLFAKYVTDKFKEVNKENFGGGKKRAEDDSQRYVLTYCTNPRIDKKIFELVNEGEKLDMSLMHELPKRVLDDIYEESWKELVNSNWTINFRNVKKIASKRCAAVLNQVITNNALNEEGTK